MPAQEEQMQRESSAGVPSSAVIVVCSASVAEFPCCSASIMSFLVLLFADGESSAESGSSSDSEADENAPGEQQANIPARRMHATSKAVGANSRRSYTARKSALSEFNGMRTALQDAD
jgi:hypothetical protein